MSRAECPTASCALVFASDESFDKHRVGVFSDDPAVDTRRCLTLDEMRRGLPVSKAGKRATWRQNSRGEWTHRPPMDHEAVAKARHGARTAAGDSEASAGSGAKRGRRVGKSSPEAVRA